MLPAPRQTCSSVPGGDDPPDAPALLRPRTLEGGRGGAESGDHSGMGRKEGDSAGSRRHWKLIPQVWLIPPGPGGCSFPVGLAHRAGSRLIPRIQAHPGWSRRVPAPGAASPSRPRAAGAAPGPPTRGDPKSMVSLPLPQKPTPHPPARPQEQQNPA